MHHVSAIAKTDTGKPSYASSQHGPICNGAFVRGMLCAFPQVLQVCAFPLLMLLLSRLIP